MKSNFISHTNYLDWFLCFSDNELTKAETSMLMQFVADNPHLKSELDDILNTKLKPNNAQTFDQKNKLKKGTADDDTSIILYIDNELNETEKINFEKSISKEQSISINRFKQTYLQADTSIVFSDKEKLYKKTKPIIALNTLLKFAASVLLLIGIGYLGIQFINKKENKNQEYAIHTIKKTPILETENIDSVTIIPKRIIAQVHKSTPAHHLVASKKDNADIQSAAMVEANISDKKSFTLKEIPGIAITDIALNNDIKIDNQLIAQQPAITIPTAISANPYQEKNKANSVFNSTLNSLKYRVLNTLSGGGDEINVAFLAINTK